MDEDEEYAKWLQQQEILSITDGESQASVALQFKIGNQSNFDDKAVAMALQEDYNQDVVETDEVIASNVQECGSDQDDETLAQKIYTRDQDYQRQLQEDEAFAKRLLEQFKDESRQNAAAQSTFSLPSSHLYGNSNSQLASDEAFARSLLEQFKAESRAGANSLPAGLEQLFGAPFHGLRGRGVGNSRCNRHFHQGAVHHQLDSGEEIGNDYEELLQLGERLGHAQDPGLRDDQLDILPTQTYRPPATVGRDSSSIQTDGPDDVAAPTPQPEEDKQCKVCFEDFQSGDTLRTLPCCHRYHRDCIDEWIKQKAICPICKLELKEEMRRSGIVS